MIDITEITEITTISHDGAQKHTDDVNALLANGWRIIAITPIGWADEYRVGDGALPYTDSHIILGRTEAVDRKAFNVGNIVNIDPPDGTTPMITAVLVSKSDFGSNYWDYVLLNKESLEHPGMAHEEIMAKVATTNGD